MRRSVALSLILLFLATANAFAIGEARMVGKVLDGATKQPVENVTFKVEAIEGKTVKQDIKVKKDGSFVVMVLDGTIRYKFSISAPGYTPYEETIKLKLGETNLRDFELFKGGAAPAGDAAAPAPKGTDPAVLAYNEGAALLNSGDIEGAIKKFDEAVTTKPDLTAGWMALAKANARAKKWPKAIEAAKKALEVDEEDTDMWTVLYQAYTATGDKANAAVAEKKLPANASALFNQAARLINEGKDSEAEAALKQAVSIDDKFAVAWYELGMVYVRAGKTAEAREALTKYIEIDPKGKDVATAKEMLNYLK